MSGSESRRARATDGEVWETLRPMKSEDRDFINSVIGAAVHADDDILIDVDDMPTYQKVRVVSNQYRGVFTSSLVDAIQESAAIPDLGLDDELLHRAQRIGAILCAIDLGVMLKNQTVPTPAVTE